MQIPDFFSLLFFISFHFQYILKAKDSKEDLFIIDYVNPILFLSVTSFLSFYLLTTDNGFFGNIIFFRLMDLALNIVSVFLSLRLVSFSFINTVQDRDY